MGKNCQSELSLTHRMLQACTMQYAQRSFSSLLPVKTLIMRTCFLLTSIKCDYLERFRIHAHEPMKFNDECLVGAHRTSSRQQRVYPNCSSFTFFVGSFSKTSAAQPNIKVDTATAATSSIMTAQHGNSITRKDKSFALDYFKGSKCSWMTI